MEACLEGLRSCGIETTACQVLSVVCPENSNAGLKEMEANVITFEESSNKIEVTKMEATLEPTEASEEV
jgi:hypothetical protein